MSTVVPSKLYTAQQSRDIDRCAIDEHGLPGPLLMGRAARSAFSLLLDRVGSCELVQILCGVGNNGGDGLLVAVLLAGRGIPVRVFLVAGEPRSADAVRAADRARSAGIVLESFREGVLEPRGIIVDAMLGTGISGALRNNYAAAVSAVNQSGLPVLALDVPTGVDSDTGHVVDEAVRADWTISFITAKRGLFTAIGEAMAGERFLDDLDVPGSAYADVEGVCEIMDLDALRLLLPRRDVTAHKGRFGRCLLLGGDHGMGGAIILAAEAALRAGVGLARVGTRAEHLSPLLARRPESMASVVNHRNDLAALLPWADAIVLGPGLGQGPWGEQLLQASLDGGHPLLLDADALNLLAVHDSIRLPPGSVISPHPGEAARLLDCDTADIQADRFGAALELASRLGTTVILKGNGSIVCRQGALALSTTGNPGMASGGMGDVLSGVVGAFLAQGLCSWDAARLAVALHGAAADKAARRRGQAGLLASDLADEFGALLP